MPGMDGMAMASHLKEAEHRPQIVFCTAWSDQALDAFERDAVDYLVKPVRRERLAAALAKAERMLDRPKGAPQASALRSTVGGRTTLIRLEEVVCFVAEDKYTTVWYDGGKTVINESLVELERRYPGILLRVHRNALVIPTRIRGLDRTSSGKCLLRLDGASCRPEVSRRQLSAVRRLLKEMS